MQPTITSIRNWRRLPHRGCGSKHESGVLVSPKVHVDAISESQGTSSGGHCNTWASLSDGADHSRVCCWRFPTRNSRNLLQAHLGDEKTPGPF